MAAALLASPTQILAQGIDLPDTSSAQQTQKPPPAVLPTVVVTATRLPESAFDLPVAIDSVTLPAPTDTLTQGGLGATLASVPGVYVQDRYTLAQDVQISSRGYGARAAFGVRGLRLLVDGIPAVTPDGQGLSSVLPLTVTDRIEVMRGPFATLYGASAGGVVQVITAEPSLRPTASAGLLVGSYGTIQSDFQAGGTFGSVGTLADVSTYRTNGYRAHSAGRRNHLYAKLIDQVNPETRLSVLVNGINQPYALDPMGLTRAELAADPRQANPAAITFDTRKSLTHRQIGTVLTHSFDDNNSMDLTDYVGTRHIEQYLAFTGSSSTSSGGVVDLSELFGGARLLWSHHGSLLHRPLTFTLGASAELGNDLRKGYVNDFGISGALRRDENDIGTTLSQYGQAEWKLSDRWSLSAGLRHTGVDLRVDDHYLADGNNGSGTATYSAVTPALGVVYRLTPASNLYASYSEGFETPTFDEIAYQSNGKTGPGFAIVPGVNFGLKAANSQNYEIGVKTFLGPDAQARLALFHIDTADEITVAGSSGGRTVYHNAGQTRRNGAELAVNSSLGHNLAANLAATLLEARYAGGLNSGHRLPGVPAASLDAGLGWTAPATGFFTGVDARWNSRVYVDDANSDAAGSYFITSWHGGFRQVWGALKLQEFAEINNIFDRKYVSAVVVADSQGRYFEPAAGRSLTIGVHARYVF